MTSLDETHDPARTSWISSANGHSDFPIQNLPFGVFAPEGMRPRGGIAIGNRVLDLEVWRRIDCFPSGLREIVEAAAQPSLNEFLALGSEPRTQMRRAISSFLADPQWCRYENEVGPNCLLYDAADCILGLPADVRNYTDFFAGIHHA